MATKKSSTKKVVKKSPTAISKLQSELNYQRAVNHELMEKLNPPMQAKCIKAESEITLTDVATEISKSNENLYNLSNAIREKIKVLTGKDVEAKDFGLNIPSGFVGEMIYHSQIVTNRTKELDELLTVLFKTI